MSLLGLFRQPDPGLVAAGVPRSSKWPAFLKAFLRLAGTAHRPPQAPVSPSARP